ncbi:hypothetical protein AAFF_G00379890 [Aldrovandia affinis]|uniref:Uncharacterized protein n=1 Tax=Aldrovandia affinis TaxID=143900 RepID=A0AAD7R6I3_9TELE|nr:hypothetical protein AAFF_G00379890 [Aldrovandia affinis]
MQQMPSQAIREDVIAALLSGSDLQRASATIMPAVSMGWIILSPPRVRAVHARARRLDPQKLAVAKAEFDSMERLGIVLDAVNLGVDTGKWLLTRRLIPACRRYAQRLQVCSCRRSRNPAPDLNPDPGDSPKTDSGMGPDPSGLRARDWEVWPCNPDP